MIVTPIQTRIFEEGESLLDFINEYVPELKENSVLAVTSKIAALAEGRTVLIESDEDKERIIRQESTFAIPTKYAWLTIKDGMVMASAGIDQSNAGEKTILLPKDSYKVAHSLREALREKHGIEKLGVVLTDSRTAPLKAGVTGVSIGYAGFKAIKDYRGKPDLFGRPFKVSQTNIADSLAASAVLTMGEGTERIPLAIIEDAPVEFAEIIDQNKTKIDIEDDMYRPLFDALPKDSD